VLAGRRARQKILFRYPATPHETFFNLLYHALSNQP
jgi:hypothetical protein